MAKYFEVTFSVDDDWIRTELEWSNGHESNFTEEQMETIIARCAENAESFKSDMYHELDASTDVFCDAIADHLRSWINDVAEDLLGDEML